MRMLKVHKKLIKISTEFCLQSDSHVVKFFNVILFILLLKITEIFHCGIFYDMQNMDEKTITTISYNYISIKRISPKM